MFHFVFTYLFILPVSFCFSNVTVTLFVASSNIISIA